MGFEKTQIKVLRYLADHYPASINLLTSYGEDLNISLRGALADLMEQGWIAYTVFSYRHGLGLLLHSIVFTPAGLNNLTNQAD